MAQVYPPAEPVHDRQPGCSSPPAPLESLGGDGGGARAADGARLIQLSTE
jgi:hypothetical protein